MPKRPKAARRVRGSNSSNTDRGSPSGTRRASGGFWDSRAALEGIEVVGKAIQTFGWPGLIFLSVGAFVVRYASDEQKRELIDTYLLMKGPLGYFGVIIGMSVLFSFVVLGQRWVYLKRLQGKQDEIDRIASEKTGQQNREIDGPLHSSGSG